MPSTPLLISPPKSRPGVRLLWPSDADNPPTERVAVVPEPPRSAFRPPSVVNEGPPASARGSKAAPVMPNPGDTFFGFRLVEELGRGTFGRVFLARQEALAGREVALKVTLRPSREAERLARLQHTHIVPVYSVHTAPPVQVICMPFVGRRTVADLLTAYRRSQTAAPSTVRAAATRRGSTTTASTRAGGPASPADAAPAPDRPAVEDTVVGEVVPVLRLLARMVDGLAHAHARRILHLDLKPANVLLADSGDPMLLDFNLAYDAAEKDREAVGGTIPYMAPEQLLDLKSRGKGGVDARTDLYSVGVMAYELLAGELPFPSPSRGRPDFDALLAARRAGPPPLREANPAVPAAVEAIVGKLLAPDPADRYQSAADLKDDIDRQLTDRPLRFAPDRSIPERVGKWRRRNPRAVRRLAVAAVAVLLAAAGVVTTREAEARADLAAAACARDTRDALHALRIDLVAPGDPDARARGIARATDLLANYGLPGEPDWLDRAKIGRLPAAARDQAVADVGEILILLARARWEQAANTDGPTRLSAAGELTVLLDRADGCFPDDTAPPLRAALRAEFAAALGGPVPATAGRKPTTPRDWFLQAAGGIGRGDFAAAMPALEQATAADPGHAAAQYCLALCRHSLGRLDQALERYDVAAALLPADPRPFFRRGTIYGQQKRFADAEAEFTKALDRDPSFADGYRNRGVARADQRKYPEAHQDLCDALDRGASRLQVLLTRATVREGMGDPAGAAADRRAVAEIEPASELDFLARGYSRLAADPAGALADLRAAERLNPSAGVTLLTQVYLLSDRLGDDAGALAVAARAVDRDPESGPARAAKALMLARLGRRDDAHREAEQVRPRRDDFHTLYQLARVYATTAAGHPADAARAVDFLRRAVKAGFRDAVRVTDDRAFGAVRSDPGLAELVKMLQDLTQ
jgi:serine/threonine protein kinase/tetratricopeptide (TPR) repeat protein